MTQIRNFAVLLALGVAWPIILQTQEVQQRPTRDVPGFKDYPAPEWTGPPAPIKLTSSSERLFRTNLRAAAKEPPNFAGHYSFVSWGCGTNCMGGAVVDLQSGKVFQLPLSENKRGEGHWTISGLFFFDNPPVQTRADSRLMIVRRELYGKDGYDPEMFYFVWEDERFRLVLHTIAGRAIN